MRDSLTALAILVIVILTAALVGPHLVDWNGQRAFIERRLSEAAGTPVTVAGRIEIALLPRPIAHLGRVTVGGVPGTSRLSAASLDAELSLTALMRGQVQVVETTLDRARLDLVQGDDGSLSLDLPQGEAADRFSLDHLKLTDATLALALADGRRVAVPSLDLEGEATTLRGPFKATGRLGSGPDAVPFRLATGVIDRGRFRLKVHVDGAALRPTIDIDGTALPAGRVAGPGFEGTATLAGRVPLDGTPAEVPWRLTARLAADRDKASASDIELRAGTDLRALIAGGDGTAAYAGADLPTLNLRLHGTGLDLDALAVAPRDSAVAPPGGADLAGMLLVSVGRQPAVALPLHLQVSASFDTATVAGRTLLGSDLTVGLGPEPAAAIAIALKGPEGARLALRGRLAPSAGSPPGRGAFTGRGELHTLDVKRTAAWLAPVAPDLAAWLDGVVPGRGLDADGDIDVSEAGVAARNLALRLDGALLKGGASYAAAAGAARGRVTADLATEGLALDRWPDLSDAAAASRGLDLDLALAAGSVSVASPSLGRGVVPASAAPLAARNLSLRLTATGDDLALQRLSLDLAGGALEATASRVGGAARAEVHVKAPRLGPVAGALASLLPGPAATLLQSRADGLSPVDATFSADAAAASGAPLLPTRLALDGTFGGTHVALGLTPDRPEDGREAAARPVTLTMLAEAPRGADLLAQLGAAPPHREGPAADLGAARLEGTAKGSLAVGFDADASATLGDTTLRFKGRAQPSRGEGRFELHARDLGPVMAATGFAAAPAPARPAEAEGGLAWSGARLTLDRIAAKLGGAAATGALSLDLTPRQAGAAEPSALGGQLSFDRLSIETLLSLALGAPAAADEPATAGTAWSSAPFGPPLATLPRGEVQLTIADLPLRGGLAAEAVSLTLRTGRGGLSLADAKGRLAGGSVGGKLDVRRDGASATLSGRLTWGDIGIDLGGLTARVSGSQDIAGIGDSPAALVGGLGGTGSIAFKAASLARSDPLAPSRTAADLDGRGADPAADIVTPDAEAVGRALGSALDRGPLPLRDQTVPATLTGGVLRLAPLRADGSAAAGWTSRTDVTLDFGASTFAERTRLAQREDRVDGGDVTVTVSGPLGGPSGPLGGAARRDIDASAFVNAVQARAIARAQDRIDVMEQDIRERMAFNRQLKAIAADQRAARDRERAEAAEKIAAEAAAKAADKIAAEAAAKAAAEARRTEMRQGAGLSSPGPTP